MNPTVARLRILIESRQPDEPLAWARPRAEQGDADGQYILGYATFFGGRDSYQEALGWFRRAAAQDHAEALFEMSRVDESRGDAYSLNPMNDMMRARLVRAADLGSDRAQDELARLYTSGRGGFTKDDVEARLWFQRAADDGNRRAKLALGEMYLDGRGGPTAVEEGIKLLEEVAGSDPAADRFASGPVFQAAARLRIIYVVGEHGLAPDPVKVAAAQRCVDKCLALIEARRARRGAGDPGAWREEDGQRITRPNRYANEAEAKEIFTTFMADHRPRDYQDLVGRLYTRQVAHERGPSGVDYEIGVHVHWDDQPGGSIKVIVSVDDAGWHAYLSIYEGYVVSRDGTVTD